MPEFQQNLVCDGRALLVAPDAGPEIWTNHNDSISEAFPRPAVPSFYCTLGTGLGHTACRRMRTVLASIAKGWKTSMKWRSHFLGASLPSGSGHVPVHNWLRQIWTRLIMRPTI